MVRLTSIKNFPFSRWWWAGRTIRQLTIDNKTLAMPIYSSPTVSWSKSQEFASFPLFEKPPPLPATTDGVGRPPQWPITEFGTTQRINPFWWQPEIVFWTILSRFATSKFYRKFLSLLSSNPKFIHSPARKHFGTLKMNDQICLPYELLRLQGSAIEVHVSYERNVLHLLFSFQGFFFVWIFPWLFLLGMVGNSLNLLVLLNPRRPLRRYFILLNQN